VRAGTLDKPSGVRPDIHIFTKSKVSWSLKTAIWQLGQRKIRWIRIPESAPAFEIYYDKKSLWPAASLERLDALLARSDSDSAR
jgi:hypothetical protein